VTDGTFPAPDNYFGIKDDVYEDLANRLGK
jgi:hypothetical protein